MQGSYGVSDYLIPDKNTILYPLIPNKAQLFTLWINTVFSVRAHHKSVNMAHKMVFTFTVNSQSVCL
jgi:hypothetical protein